MSDPGTILMLLAIALALDAVFGEPEWLYSRIPHPIVLGGKAIGFLDWRLNRSRDSASQQKASGIIAMVLLAAGGAMLGLIVEAIPFGALLSALIAAVLLSHRSLVEHVEAVGSGLAKGLDEGRAAVGRIVGRDPEALDEAGVARAAIESAAENFSDGIVAPAFWFAVAGLPGLIVYKLVNTADSMIGHRNEKYRHFGWAAARLDDLMNLVPARLTAALFALADLSLTPLKTAWRDAKGHKSPNAGWPEAAMAAILDLRLAGPRRYEGRIVDDPWMNPEGREDATPDDIAGSVNLIWRAWAVLLAASIFGALVL
ncbi:MAG: adenosylcobinamide-phosphate synthase CbiB [Minwuia sp.]|uniref:adenosylcobinamide-phosphate synthase CbiB n=1 Tax=Minwuia sp. TaxID=2493630 RepID=UPI003A8B77C6